MQLLCLHKWQGSVCQKCGKVETVHTRNEPEFANILPTDYYGYKAKHETDTDRANVPVILQLHAS